MQTFFLVLFCLIAHFFFFDWTLRLFYKCHLIKWYDWQYIILSFWVNFWVFGCWCDWLGKWPPTKLPSCWRADLPKGSGGGGAMLVRGMQIDPFHCGTCKHFFKSQCSQFVFCLYDTFMWRNLYPDVKGIFSFNS